MDVLLDGWRGENLEILCGSQRCPAMGIRSVVLDGSFGSNQNLRLGEAISKWTSGLVPSCRILFAVCPCHDSIGPPANREAVDGKAQAIAKLDSYHMYSRVRFWGGFEFHPGTKKPQLPTSLDTRHLIRFQFPFLCCELLVPLLVDNSLPPGDTCCLA